MLILERLEQSFDHKEPVDLKTARPSIEHVMPQTLTDEWRQHLIDHGDDPLVVHSQLLHTLGNLTLSAYNTELSNRVFDRKQQMYSSSHFELNKALADSPSWTSKEILARADELADRIIRIWSGPLSSGEGAPETTDWARVDAAIAIIPADCTCTVAELAQLVPASPEALLARLRTRSAQRGVNHVLDDRGQPVGSVRVPDVEKQAMRRALTACEMAQLMPFEFDDEELKALRRKRSPGAARSRYGSADVASITAFLQVAEGLEVATLPQSGRGSTNSAERHKIPLTGPILTNGFPSAWLEPKWKRPLLCGNVPARASTPATCLGGWRPWTGCGLRQSPRASTYLRTAAGGYWPATCPSLIAHRRLATGGPEQRSSLSFGNCSGSGLLQSAHVLVRRNLTTASGSGQLRACEVSAITLLYVASIRALS
jgi:hypothetical protein